MTWSAAGGWHHQRRSHDFSDVRSANGERISSPRTEYATLPVRGLNLLGWHGGGCTW